jgi:hypothetical protein
MLLQIDPATKFATRIRGEQLKTFGLDERGFQQILFDQLDRLLPDHELLLLMQSRRWREEPDLMAIDAKGRLYIFELKVWESTPETLLQVLRYGQIFGPYGCDELDRLYRSFHKTGRSLREAHKANFGIELNEEDFNRSQRFVVCANGLDFKTREAIRYWKKAGLDVRPWVYRVYGEAGGKMLLELNAFRVEDDPYEDLAQGYYVLNTNIRNDPQDDQYMIERQRAAAFFDPWKRKIERLSKGDVVFLYRSGEGIVAAGVASGRLEKRPYHGDPQHPDEEYSMVLSNFRPVSPPLRAAEIKEIVGTWLVFRPTMFGLDAEAGMKLLARVRSTV